MNTNKWKEFAKLFGLELKEEFFLKHNDGEVINKGPYKFVEYGLLLTGDYYFEENKHILHDLIDGKIEIIKKPWKPKELEHYWVYYHHGITQYYCWDGSVLDLALWKSGNCFKTEEEAETKGKEIMEQIRKEFEYE